MLFTRILIHNSQMQRERQSKQKGKPVRLVPTAIGHLHAHARLGVNCKRERVGKREKEWGGCGGPGGCWVLCEMMVVPKFTHNYKATRDGAAADAGSNLPASQLLSSLRPYPPCALFACLYQQFMRMIYASARAGGLAYTGRCGRGMASCDFRKRRSHKNKQGESRKPRSARSAGIYLLFDYKQRWDAADPPPPPPSVQMVVLLLLLLLPLDPHSTLDWLLCETLNAKSEQNNTCSINASAGCQLAGSQFPLSLLPPTPRKSGNLLKNIKKPAPRVNEKRTRTRWGRRGEGARRRATCG